MGADRPLRRDRASRQKANKTSRPWRGRDGGGESGDYNGRVNELMGMDLDKQWDEVDHDDENADEQYLNSVYSWQQ